jgi:hypothetical protein
MGNFNEKEIDYAPFMSSERSKLDAMAIVLVQGSGEIRDLQ